MPMTTTETRDAPAFDFYPERWLVGTAAMTDAEQISYLRLLCHQWMNGDAGLPNDAATLRRLAGRGCTETVRAKFPAGADGRLRNRRLEILRHEQRERIRKRSEQRRTAARKRWHSPADGETLSADDAYGSASADPYIHGQEHEHVHDVALAASAAEPAFACPEVHAATDCASAGQRGQLIEHEKIMGNNESIGHALSAETDAAASPPQCGGHAHHPPPTTHPNGCTSVESTRGPAAPPAAAPGAAGAGTAARSHAASPPCGAPPLAYGQGGALREPPKPALDDVQAYAPTVGAVAMCAEHFWNECQAAGWRTRHGQRIVDWQALFRNYASTWKSLEARRSGSGKGRPGGRWKGAGKGKGKSASAGGRTRPAAYTVESATRGLSSRDIGQFSPDQK